MRPTATLSFSAAPARSAPTRRALLGTALATAVAAPLPGTPARAQPAWPTRTVRLVTLAAPGAGTDAVARTLAEALSRRWDQPVVVDNRPGGEGIVSIETFLAAREGNHTLAVQSDRRVDGAAADPRKPLLRCRPRSDPARPSWCWISSPSPPRPVSAPRPWRRSSRRPAPAPAPSPSPARPACPTSPSPPS